jgi:hypothetical protein
MLKWGIHTFRIYLSILGLALMLVPLHIGIGEVPHDAPRH